MFAQQELEACCSVLCAPYCRVLETEPLPWLVYAGGRWKTGYAEGASACVNSGSEKRLQEVVPQNRGAKFKYGINGCNSGF